MEAALPVRVRGEAHLRAIPVRPHLSSGMRTLGGRRGYGPSHRLTPILYCASNGLMLGVRSKGDPVTMNERNPLARGL